MTVKIAYSIDKNEEVFMKLNASRSLQQPGHAQPIVCCAQYWTKYYS